MYLSFFILRVSNILWIRIRRKFDLSNLSKGLKCPVDILSGGSREANPPLPTKARDAKFISPFLYISNFVDSIFLKNLGFS